MTFGQRIREERKKRNWSQEYLAHRADLHPTEVSRLERDTREPRLRTALQVAHGLGISIGELLEGVEMPRPAALAAAA